MSEFKKVSENIRIRDYEPHGTHAVVVMDGEDFEKVIIELERKGVEFDYDLNEYDEPDVIGDLPWDGEAIFTGEKYNLFMSKGECEDKFYVGIKAGGEWEKNDSERAVKDILEFEKDFIEYLGKKDFSIK